MLADLPYRTIIFTILFVALLLALPLGSFGNVLDVLPLLGSMLSFNIYYVVRLLQGNELDDTVRATIVLQLTLSVVASSLSSPFELKRMLFNLYPATRERIASTAARDHAYSVEGLYALEEQVFREVGLPRPQGGPIGPALPSFRADLTAPPQRVLGGVGPRLRHVVEYQVQLQYGS
jgi:hypothetical protein